METLITPGLLTAMLTWRAIIDVLLVATGLFLLYRALLSLGTWKIVSGVLIAMVFFIIANLLDLKGIEWVFNNITQVAAIALIIIFQPEIRKLLERTASIRRSRKAKPSKELSLMLSDAIFALAQKRQGAIVVLPGHDPIEEWSSGGYLLNAVASIPLILSIFDPNSPGHDGALISKDGLLTRFGVRLPLSQSAKLSDEYGTRHHAAMGLSEKSDAMVIVASEERGSVSIFTGGRMHPLTNREALVRSILAHGAGDATQASEGPRSKSKGLIVTQMIMSLVVAVLFYATLITAQGEILEKVITVPVEYTTSPSHLVLIGDKSKEVRLHLSGPKSDLDSVDLKQLSVKIDLSKAIAGKQSFLITMDNLRLPRSVALLDVTPQSIELELAEIIEQDIAIKPQLVGKLPAGLKLRSIEMVPEKVSVLLPISQKSIVSQGVITTPIYLEGITEDANIFCKVIAPPSVHPVDKRWPDVQVKIMVAPK